MVCNKHLKFNRHLLYIDTHTYIHRYAHEREKREGERVREERARKGEGKRETVVAKIYGGLLKC